MPMINSGTRAERTSARLPSSGNRALARFRLRSVERVAAGAGAARVGVVDREALLLDRVDEVDRGAAEVRAAHPVDDDLDATELVGLVAIEEPLVEEELVAQAGAAAGLNGDAQPQVVAALLVQQGLDLRGRGLAEQDPGGDGRAAAEGRAVLHRHVVSSQIRGCPLRHFCNGATPPRR